MGNRTPGQLLLSVLLHQSCLYSLNTVRLAVKTLGRNVGLSDSLLTSLESGFVILQEHIHTGYFYAAKKGNNADYHKSYCKTEELTGHPVTVRVAVSVILRAVNTEHNDSTAAFTECVAASNCRFTSVSCF